MEKSLYLRALCNAFVKLKRDLNIVKVNYMPSETRVVKLSLKNQFA